ncbi:hypothetical protein OHV05_34400 [Kitasatospora sp. NBC_00070]|uniref:hypothetical protein n=1 Tax=Kitasatospora sp. NBC_00070 TaxID=2975962 RepID=UPI003249F969
MRVANVSLDPEFLPPWQRRTHAGEPVVVTTRLTAESVVAAAIEWAAEIEPYPPF